MLALAAAAWLGGCKPAGDGASGDGGMMAGAPVAVASGGAAAVASDGADPARPVIHVLAIGDSLFAGYGLSPEQAYPVKLGAALRARGLNVGVVNASVSGDTTADGAARLGFSLDGLGGPSGHIKPDLVIICLGGNDMLRALPPATTRANLEAMLSELDKRHIRVMLMGMLAAPNLGKDYARDFDAAYPALARAHHAALVPFFLSAVIDHPELRQADHMHPTAAGVDAVVAATLPEVARALRR